MMPSVGQKSNLTNHIDKAPKARNPFAKGEITRIYAHTHTRTSKHTYGRYKLALITLYRAHNPSIPSIHPQWPSRSWSRSRDEARRGERQLSIHAVSLNFDIFLFVFGFAITHSTFLLLPHPALLC